VIAVALAGFGAPFDRPTALCPGKRAILTLAVGSAGCVAALTDDGERQSGDLGADLSNSPLSLG
jgi:hypothetical protein